MKIRYYIFPLYILCTTSIAHANDAYIFSIGKTPEGIAGHITAANTPQTCQTMASNLTATINDGTIAGIYCGNIQGTPSAGIFFGKDHTAIGMGALSMVGPHPSHQDGCYHVNPYAKNGGTAEYISYKIGHTKKNTLCIYQHRLTIK